VQLSLPRGFGSAHVGEIFSCTLCANNELLPTNTSRTVSSIRIVAEMQTPTQSVPLELQSASAEEPASDHNASSAPGSSIQRTITFDLKEEGSHVLAVNVSYTETINQAAGTIPTSRPRSFRKLYQFVAQPCLSVRTKATELPLLKTPTSSTPLLRFVLEAQLENVGDAAVVLEVAKLLPRPPFKSMSLNWDSEDFPADNPKLAPRDVMQVAFLVEQDVTLTDGLEELRGSLKRDGRAMLGQLAIEWRSSMGDRGFLSTGNLLSRRKT
jgi:trafficking protein particle complex subunit 13